MADAAHQQAGRDPLDVFGLHGSRPAYWRAYQFIESACAAAGVDWRGRPVAPSKIQPKA